MFNPNSYSINQAYRKEQEARAAHTRRVDAAQVKSNAVKVVSQFVKRVAQQAAQAKPEIQVQVPNWKTGTANS